MLATALVSNCINDCNLLLYGIADMDIPKLQRVQNRLARIVTKSPSFSRSVLLLRSLHWLLVKLRILFKISLPTYMAINEKQPVYQSINQSINKTSIVPISPAKPGSVARQPNQCSLANTKKQFHRVIGPSGMLVSMGESPS